MSALKCIACLCIVSMLAITPSYSKLPAKNPLCRIFCADYDSFPYTLNKKLLVPQTPPPPPQDGPLVAPGLWERRNVRVIFTKRDWKPGQSPQGWTLRSQPQARLFGPQQQIRNPQQVKTEGRILWPKMSAQARKFPPVQQEQVFPPWQQRTSSRVLPPWIQAQSKFLPPLQRQPAPNKMPPPPAPRTPIIIDKRPQPMTISASIPDTPHDKHIAVVVSGTNKTKATPPPPTTTTTTAPRHRPPPPPPPSQLGQRKVVYHTDNHGPIEIVIPDFVPPLPARHPAYVGPRRPSPPRARPAIPIYYPQPARNPRKPQRIILGPLIPQPAPNQGPVIRPAVSPRYSFPPGYIYAPKYEPPPFRQQPKFRRDPAPRQRRVYMRREPSFESESSSSSEGD